MSYSDLLWTIWLTDVFTIDGPIVLSVMMSSTIMGRIEKMKVGGKMSCRADALNK